MGSNPIPATKKEGMEIENIIIICNAYDEGYKSGLHHMPPNNPYPEDSVNFIAYAYGYSNSTEESLKYETIH